MSPTIRMASGRAAEDESDEIPRRYDPLPLPGSHTCSRGCA